MRCMPLSTPACLNLPGCSVEAQPSGASVSPSTVCQSVGLTAYDRALAWLGAVHTTHGYSFDPSDILAIPRVEETRGAAR